MKMSNVGLVMSAGIKNAFRMKIALTILFLITLICVAGVVFCLCVLLIAPEVNSAAPDPAALKGYLSMMLYAVSFIAIGVTLNSFIQQTLVKEKARGNLNALMATPMKLSDIWLGKSLALFIPGLVLGIVLTVLTLIIVNLIYFIPNTGFLCGPEMLISSLVAVPLIYLFFGMLVHLLGLIAKPTTANVIAQIFLPVMANLVIQLTARNVMDANSWHFMVANLGLALVIGIIVLAVRSRLIPERVVLSG